MTVYLVTVIVTVCFLVINSVMAAVYFLMFRRLQRDRRAFAERRKRLDARAERADLITTTAGQAVNRLWAEREKELPEFSAEALPIIDDYGLGCTVRAREQCLTEVERAIQTTQIKIDDDVPEPMTAEMLKFHIQSFGTQFALAMVERVRQSPVV